MRTVVDIYEKYRIPPWLQEHQLRVAAMGKLLAERIKGTDEQSIILAGLFHDMGNILKTDLTLANPLLALVGEENLAHWQEVKNDFIARYGTSDHDATEAIIREISLPPSVCALIRNMGFAKVPEILVGGSNEQQIIEYADQRVGPYGVLSLGGRFAEGQKRYKGRFGHLGPEEVERREKIIAAAHEIERRLCERANIRPEEITDATIAPIIEELRKYEVS